MPTILGKPIPNLNIYTIRYTFPADNEVRFIDAFVDKKNLKIWRLNLSAKQKNKKLAETELKKATKPHREK